MSFLYFLEFPLLAQSSHPSRSFTGQTSSHLLSTWLGLDAEGFLDESWCHALWMEKSKRKKAPGTGFSRPLRIPLFQSCFWKSFCRFLKQFLAYYSVSVWRAVIGWSRGWCNRSSSWAACGYRFADVRQQVRVTGQLLDIYPILLSVGQTASDKCLCFWRDYWLWRELHLGSFQNRVLLQNVLLWLVVAKGLSAIETLIEDNSYWPDINFIWNLWRFFPNYKTFWW